MPSSHCGRSWARRVFVEFSTDRRAYRGTTRLSPLRESCRQQEPPTGITSANATLRNNRDFIPNYGERYRHGETISTAIAESTVNQVISKRMVKRQQMQWSQRGAHLLLQTRTRVLNDELEKTFRGWYPQFRPEVPRSSPSEARPPGF